MLKPEMILLDNWKIVKVYPCNDDKLKAAVDYIYKMKISDWDYFCEVYGEEAEEEYVKEEFEDNLLNYNTYTMAVKGNQIKFVEELIEHENNDNLNLNFEVIEIAEMSESIEYIKYRNHFFIRNGENDWFSLDDKYKMLIG